ncbi:RRN3 [Lepeophtheirus salmonis]|uniref:RRN3 n=1 Tax=Lepeophtheirus salmonis TaxID=72036 RepID=A0A7R8CXI2_LEPSM|nr:RRN3 [Lepeophtheirus salmonis]CAF2931341.1 RRN3 [Lepeophtheirus salmonis]
MIPSPLFFNQSASSSQVNPIIKARNNMEQLMTLLLNFVEEESKGEEAKQLYLDFFEPIRLLYSFYVGYRACSVCSILSREQGSSLCPQFSKLALEKIPEPHLIARGKFIPLNTAKCYLEKIVSWIHLYIKNSEYANKDFMYADIKTHGPFYAAVQSALYMFAFRHEEFMDNKKNLEFLKSLNFNTIVTCSLNPLRVCLPPVVKNFASISRNYQLAYCDTIIQRNNRINLPIVGSLSESSSSAKPLLLDSFFPFDPYSLKDSDSFISPLYRKYSSSSNAESVSDSEEEEEEEVEGMEIGSLKEVPSFHYGTSPGFKMI